MEYIIFDTETTGFQTKDEVIQFAGFLVDDNCKLLRLYSFYCYPLIEIPDDAIKVHHLTKSILMKLSDGRFFEEQFFEYDDLLSKKDLTWVGYNVDYDKRMINQTLKNNGYTPYKFGNKVAGLYDDIGVHSFDVMSAIADRYNHGKWEKLATCVRKYCSLSLEQINKEYECISKYCGMQTEFAFHNAIYDAFTTYCLFKDMYPLTRM